MNITKATVKKRAEIISLLQSQELPSDDLPLLLNDFYTAMEGDQLIGLIGLERYGQYGLLRSMVVHPDYRNQQIAGSLVKMLEEKATSTGINSIYLLTETAAGYFSKKGYDAINRTEVPKDLMKSSEFSHVCPESATVMMKKLQESIN